MGGAKNASSLDGLLNPGGYYSENITAGRRKIAAQHLINPATLNQSTKIIPISHISCNHIKINVLQHCPAPFPPNNRYPKAPLARNLR
jgi:hypothetical protein